MNVAKVSLHSRKKPSELQLKLQKLNTDDNALTRCLFVQGKILH